MRRNSDLDYSVLDRPEVLEFVFYPRRDWTEAPAGSTDHMVQVEDGVSLSCRFYFASLSLPSILFFHGNGELACDYDSIAPMYKKLGVNLFVADYRGYGLSGGRPTISHLMSDSHRVYRYFRDMLRDQRHTGGVLVMGRSLGSYPAVELAHGYQDGGLKGLIIESGFSSVARLLANLGLPLQLPGLDDLDRGHMDKVRSIRMPALVIHGEWDLLVPFQEGRDLYDGLGSSYKRLFAIPGAGHNDIMLVGMDDYFSAIKDFVLRFSREKNG